MSKKDIVDQVEAKRSKRIKKLAKIAVDKSRPKKERIAALEEHDKLIAEVGTFVPSPASGDTQAEAFPESLFPLVDEVEVEKARRWQAKQDAEVAAQWARRKTIDYKIKAPAEVDYKLDDPTGIAADLIVEELEEPEAVSGKDTIPAPPQEAVESETDHGREFVVGAVTLVDPVLEAPADPVLQNGNGQAMIHYRDATGAEKVKGYTRVTTYIDGLDDKTVLTEWKMRTLLEGGAVELLQHDGDSPSLSAVARAVKRLDEALADIDRRESVEGELLELRRQELLKEHRDLLERTAEDLMELGGAHEKANKGTDLHRLTELVDNGQPLPDSTTASDRRDVEAYQAKMTELGITTLWTERRVVLDDIQVSGTMDRAYQVKLPGMQRRIRVVGDLKTGSVSYSHGKIATQLLLYARGEGYDWTQPLERARLSLSKSHGLLVHLPQGEGRCEVYVVDLELAAQGLDLAAKVREWRRTQRRAYDLKSPLTPSPLAGA